MSLEELLKINKLIYGAEPKISVVENVQNSTSRTVYGEVSNKILYIPLDAIGTISVQCRFADNTTFTRSYVFSKVFNMYALRKEVNSSKKILYTTFTLSIFTGISGSFQTINANTTMYKGDSIGEVQTTMQRKFLTALSNPFVNYNLTPWYLLEYDQTIQIW